MVLAEPLVDITAQRARADHLVGRLHGIPGTVVEIRDSSGNGDDASHIAVDALLPASVAVRIGHITGIRPVHTEGRLMKITLPMDLMGMDINSQPETVDGCTIDRGAAMKAIETELGLYKKATQRPVEALMR